MKKEKENPNWAKSLESTTLPACATSPPDPFPRVRLDLNLRAHFHAIMHQLANRWAQLANRARSRVVPWFWQVGSPGSSSAATL
jgi:hypothetical protein